MSSAHDSTCRTISTAKRKGREKRRGQKAVTKGNNAARIGSIQIAGLYPDQPSSCEGKQMFVVAVVRLPSLHAMVTCAWSPFAEPGQDVLGSFAKNKNKTSLNNALDGTHAAA